VTIPHLIALCEELEECGGATPDFAEIVAKPKAKQA
jgi:hypothetical protein